MKTRERETVREEEWELHACEGMEMKSRWSKFMKKIRVHIESDDSFLEIVERERERGVGKHWRIQMKLSWVPLPEHLKFWIVPTSDRASAFNGLNFVVKNNMIFQYILISIDSANTQYIYIKKVYHTVIAFRYDLHDQWHNEINNNQ